GSMYDLNTLIPPHKNQNVPFGSNINDWGVITGAIVNAQGVERAIVLIPHGSAHVLPNGVSAPKITLPQSLRMRLGNPAVRFWDLRSKSAILR
ncbi:MAG: hypothetical protein JO113_05955, partial [Candidatus Eremiobacteraeota bacterium]|nr:hypothetical protein [Candidatus Eremiobacteraeota bacterium]